MTFSVPAREATRILAPDDRSSDLGIPMIRHLEPRVGVRVRGQACASEGEPRLLRSQRGYVRIEWRFKCAAEGAMEIENHVLFDVVSSHVHFARVDTGTGRSLEYLFTDYERTRTVRLDQETVRTPESGGATFLAYLRLGTQHIIAGFDHLAFLAALLLLTGRLREMVLIITGFTVGHSITLSLAVLRVARPDVPVIEALIGFTVALVAAENIGVSTQSSRTIGRIAGVSLGALAVLAAFAGIGPPVVTLAGLALFSVCYLSLADTPELALRLRPAITVLFGLIHGFGFANILLELGIPNDRLLAGLFGFNLGVELGQLAAVTVLYVLASRVIVRIARVDRRLAVDATSAALCGLGLFWFVGRAYTG
jgi:hypothetical protein